MFSKIILKNVLSNWVGFAVDALLAFATAPFIVHRLGDSSYGIWILILSISGYYGLLTLGLRPAINKYVSQFHAEGNREDLHSLINSSFFLSLLAAAATLIVSAFVAMAIAQIFRLPPDLIHAARIVSLIMGLQLALGLISSVFGGVLSGLQRYDIHSLIGIVVGLVRTVLIFLILGKYPTLLVISGISFFATACGYALTIHYALKQISPFKLSLEIPKKNVLRLLIRYSSITYFVAIGVQLIYYADSVVIAYFLSAAAITYFSIAGNLLAYLRSFVEATTTVLNPAASELAAKGDTRRLRELIISSAKATLTITLPIAISFIVVGREFITLWMGPQYGISATILVILSISHILSLSQYGTRAILYGLGKHRFVAYTTMIEGVINLGLSLALVKPLGIVGVALGTAIPAVLSDAVWLPVVICRLYSIRIVDYVRQAYLPPILSAIVFVGSLKLLSIFFEPTTWPKFSMTILFSSIMFVLAAFSLCLEKYQREQALAMLRRELDYLITQ
jgi:O-antigen/teichoic acid export membrane protein